MRLLKAFLFVALSAVVYGLAHVPHVQAAPPSNISFTFSDPAPAVAANCGSFNVMAQYQGSVSITTFFDSNGFPVRLQFHGQARGVIFNSVTGFTVKDAPSIRNSFVDLVMGTEANVGVDFHVTVPGAGVVILQAGRVVFNAGGPPPVFVAGPHLGPPAAQEAV